MWFSGSPCTFLSTPAVRIGADVIHRIFSFAVFSSSLSAAWREGPRPAEEPTLFTSTCQTSAAWLPSAAQSQCAEICVCACFACALSHAFSGSSGGIYIFTLMTFSVVRVRLFKISSHCRLPVGSTKTVQKLPWLIINVRSRFQTKRLQNKRWKR